MKSQYSVAPTVRRTFVCAIVTTGMLLPAYAQDKDEPEQTVVVTGSRITRQTAETPSPIQIISRDDLEKSGQQNIADIIRSVSSDGQGSIPTAFTQGFAAGASAVSLRGLGVNATLVLVNGRRMAPYGLADDGTRVFVDLNSLPLEAVERVEVLKDSASAVYGSDAIAGVVNIILRKEFQGATLSGDTGTSYNDDGTVVRLSGSYGFGDLGSNRYNVYITAEGSRQDAINNTDRSGFLGTEDLTSIGFFDGRAGSALAGRGVFEAVSGPNSGANYQSRTPYGTVRTPGGNLFQRTNLTPCPELSQLPGRDENDNPIVSNICLFDRASYYEIQPKVDRANLFARGTYNFTDNLQGYTELGWFHSKTAYVNTPSAFDDTGVYDATSTTLVGAAHIAILPAAHPDNPFGEDLALRYLASDFGGRNGIEDSDVTRVIVGLEGTVFSEWDYNLGAGYVESKLDSTNTGYIRFSQLQAALDSGAYRINNPSLVSAATFAAISPTARKTSTNSIAMADASISGSLFELPGGPMGLAVGAEWRKEKTNNPPEPFTDIGDIIGLGYSTFKSDRDIYASYVELNAPITDMLEVDGAFRYDHYSDFGHSTTPKLGVKLTPIKQISLRGTYSEGFRAPGPAEAGDSIALGFTNIALISVGNPNLKPEESKSYTLGIVVEPFKGTSASVDYYRIKRANEIQQADQATILGGLPLTGVPGSIVPGAQPGSFVIYDEDGNLATASGPYVNANQTTTAGIDFDIRQRFELGASGKLEAALTWTYVSKFEKELTDGSILEYVGTQGPYSLSSATGTPRNRAALQATWSLAGLELTGRLNYVAAMDLIDHQGESLVDNGDGTFSTTTGEGAYVVADPSGQVCGVYNPDGTPFNHCRSKSFTTFDLFGKYSLSSHLDIRASIDNVFNKTAPFNPYTYGALNYNSAFTQEGAIGRFLTVGARYKF